MRLASLLCVALLSAHAGRARGFSFSGWVGSWFGSSSAQPDSPANRTLESYGPMIYRTATAYEYLSYSANASAVGAAAAAGAPAAQVPFGKGGVLTVTKAGPPQLPTYYVAFQLGADASTDGWGKSVARIPFLRRFVYTAEAPTAVLAEFNSLAGNDTSGRLAQAIREVAAGDEVLQVVCTGENAAGGLALLCGPAVALAFPEANVDVITFGTPWEGFSAPFAWAFQQLVNVHYFWPWSSKKDLPAVTAADPASSVKVADALLGLMTSKAVELGLAVPNLPPAFPKGWDELKRGAPIGPLAPNASLPEEYRQLPSDCPPITCKTRRWLNMSCNGWRNSSVLEDLPHAVLRDNKTSADAIVAWNASSLTAIVLFKYTEEKTDWLVDAVAIQTEPLDPKNDPTGVIGRFGEVEVHSGFLSQLLSLTDKAKSGETNITAQLYKLSGGVDPARVVVSGFSLGGALSELFGSWAASRWPAASVMVVNQGAPKTGNTEWVRLATAAYGRAYKYVYEADQVPTLPPLPTFKTLPGSIWITNNEGVILQARPSLSRTTWDDHTCYDWTFPDGRYLVGYVPRVMAATTVGVPAWIYSATPADSSGWWIFG